MLRPYCFAAGRASMAEMSKRDRAQQVVLVVLGLLAVITNVWALVDYFLAGPRPTGGTAAPMFWTILAVLAIQLPTKRGELLIGAAAAGLAAALLFVFAPRKETALATS